jgi:hypothetical protein
MPVALQVKIPLVDGMDRMDRMDRMDEMDEE